MRPLPEQRKEDLAGWPAPSDPNENLIRFMEGIVAKIACDNPNRRKRKANWANPNSEDFERLVHRLDKILDKDKGRG